MRLFVALVPPPDALRELAAALAPLRAAPEGQRVRWSDPDGWHVTLAFLGETDPALLPELKRRLDAAAAEHPVHRLRLTGSGRFGAEYLWTGISGERTVLTGLAASVSEAARATGIAVDDRPYRPHLTVARVKRSAVSGDGLDLLEKALSGLSGTEWTADRAVLFSSSHGSAALPGPHYQPLSEHSLATSAPADTTANSAE